MQTYNNMNTLFGYFLKIQNKNKTYKMTLKYLNKLSKSKHFKIIIGYLRMIIREERLSFFLAQRHP